MESVNGNLFQNNSNYNQNSKLDITHVEGLSSLAQFLNETEEFNDIIITNKCGDVIYFYSQYKTLDEDYFKKFLNDFK